MESSAVGSREESTICLLDFFRVASRVAEHLRSEIHISQFASPLFLSDQHEQVAEKEGH